MKILIALFALLTVSASALEESFFAYADLHAMSGYPMVGLGIRSHKGVHAIDLSANACPLNPWKSFQSYHLRGLYLFFPRQTGFYLGGGLGYLNEPETLKKTSATLEAALGFQWRRLFLEGNIMSPYQRSHYRDRDKLGAGMHIWPGLTLGFGF